MSAADPLLVETLTRMLDERCRPELVERAKRGEWPKELWDTLEAAGFPLAWVPETRGGAGAGLADGFGPEAEWADELGRRVAAAGADRLWSDLSAGQRQYLTDFRAGLLVPARCAATRWSRAPRRKGYGRSSALRALAKGSINTRGSTGDFTNPGCR